MTEEEMKANELYEKYFMIITKRGEYSFSHNDSINCAVQSVNEIVKELKLNVYPMFQYENTFKFWKGVKLILNEMRD
jgi:glucose-6-phosphate 1-dehydrogenase